MVETCVPSLLYECVVLMVASPPTLIHVVGIPMYDGHRFSHPRRNERYLSHGKKHSCYVDARTTSCFSFEANMPTRPSLLAFARCAPIGSRRRLPCTVKLPSSCVFASLSRHDVQASEHLFFRSIASHPIVPPVVRRCPWVGGPSTPFPPVSWLVIGGNTPPHGFPPLDVCQLLFTTAKARRRCIGVGRCDTCGTDRRWHAERWRCW